MEKTKIGIIICDRYHTCAGGKCLRALRNREGAFSIYKDREVELVGYTTCGGCPGGNVEYAPEEMVKNGAEVIHLATGLVVGYPPGVIEPMAINVKISTSWMKWISHAQKKPRVSSIALPSIQPRKPAITTPITP